MKSRGLHDGTAIIQVTVQCRCGAVAFPDREAKPRSHGREMPAELDLFRFSEQAEEFSFVAVEEPGLLRGDFFCRVRSAHPNDGIFAPEALDKLGKTARLSENAFSHFVRASDGAFVRAVEKICYLLQRHVVKD